jgi:hypothetical protein
VLTDEKLDDIGARPQHTARKSLKRLAQETKVSTSSARTVTQMLTPSSESWCLCAVSARRIVVCVFRRNNFERYLRAEGQRFQHLLWSVNKDKNFPSFQMLSACSVIANILMRSAASGAPVPVKNRAVNASSLLKKHSVFNLAEM